MNTLALMAHLPDGGALVWSSSTVVMTWDRTRAMLDATVNNAGAGGAPGDSADSVESRCQSIREDILKSWGHRVWYEELLHFYSVVSGPQESTCHSQILPELIHKETQLALHPLVHVEYTAPYRMGAVRKQGCPSKKGPDLQHIVSLGKQHIRNRIRVSGVRPSAYIPTSFQRAGDAVFEPVVTVLKYNEPT